MANVTNPELELLSLVKQRDAITAQINGLLQRIVGGAESSPAPTVKRGRPAKSGAKRRGRPVGWRKASAAPAASSATPAVAAAPKKRGRPVGWRKASAAPAAASTPAAAPKKRGRPVGWRKATAAPAAGAAPKKRGRPVGWRKATASTSNAAKSGPAVKRKAGRPKGSSKKSK